MRRSVSPACLSACLCVCLSACGGASGGGDAGARTLGQPSAPLDWATQWLGTPPLAVSVLRPYDGSDSLERDKSKDPSPIDYATFHCRQADFYFSANQDDVHRRPLDGDITVLHGVPTWLDPLRAYPPAVSAPGWIPVATSSSGVRAYRGTRGEREPVQLYVLPSSTWVVATGVAGQRLGWAFASSAPEPPYLDALPGIFSQSTAAIGAGELSRSGKCWVHDCTRVVAAGEVMYPPAGRSLAVGTFLMFPDEDTARDAATDARRLLADPATRERLVGRSTGDERFAGVQNVGRAVVFLTAVGGQDSTSTRAPPSAPRPAPDAQLASINGKGVASMVGLRGKVVVLHFWGTWDAVGKSAQHVASLERLAERYGSSGLEVIGVAEENDGATVLRYAREHGLSFRLVLDDEGTTKRSWAPDAFPATVVVDRKGDVKTTEYYLHQGDVDDQAVEEEVRSLL